jgi:hypothetical protein
MPILNNSEEINKSSLEIIVRVAKRSLDLLAAKNPDGDIISTPKTTAEMITFGNNVDAVIESKLRKFFKI